LQVEMGLYGAIIVLPANVPAVCASGLPTTNPGGNAAARTTWGESDFRLAAAAYDHPDTCYDREYLFQFSEMDPNIHIQALAQVTACAAPTAALGCHLNVPTEPYQPVYFMINGRSMPDDMDSNYAAQYPHQPYNGNPHMHPGELTLLRIIGQGRWQHPFHEHGNNVRVLACDGKLRAAVDPGRQRLQHRCNGRGQLLRVVPGPQQALASQAVRRCGRRRPGNAARSEPVHQRCLVRRQPLSGPGRDGTSHRSDRDDPAFGHDRQLPDGRGRVRLHVALP